MEARLDHPPTLAISSYALADLRISKSLLKKKKLKFFKSAPRFSLRE
jgi:hypothetical protein